MILQNFLRGSRTYPDYCNKELIVKELDLTVKVDNLEPFGISAFVFYKNVPMWACLNLKPYTRAFLMKPSGEGETYTIIGYTPVGEFDSMPKTDIFLEIQDVDTTTYGDWATEAEALDWLENPKVLYSYC